MKPASIPAPHERSKASSISTRSSTSTSRPSAARRAPTPPPIPAPSRRSATGSPACPKPRRAATAPAASRSTSRAGAAKPARATASSRSKCTSCPMSTSPAMSARQALQPRNARSPLQGQVDRRRAGHDGRRSRRILQGRALIREKLETLNRVGLGYIKVGQQATTLSGGEAQRVKLAKELSKRATGRTLYILDEPTTGLHFEDVRNCWKCCIELVDQGNTVRRDRA
jgi:hypothetical protein